MYCKDCGSNIVISVTHFEKNKNPTRYSECQKCHSKSKEILISFGEVLNRIQNTLDAE